MLFKKSGLIDDVMRPPTLVIHYNDRLLDQSPLGIDVLKFLLNCTQQLSKVIAFGSLGSVSQTDKGNQFVIDF